MAAAFVLAAAQAEDANVVLRRLIGKDRTTVERLIGLPDTSESNGVQTFLRYRAFDSWRTGGGNQFGYTQGYSGGRGFQGSVNFDCITTLVFVEDVLRSYSRSGIGCQPR